MQTEAYIIDELKTLNEKIDTLMPLPTKVEGINQRLDRLNGSTGKNTDNISGHSRDIATLTNDVSWLKRFFWVLATASISGLIGAVYAVIFK